MALTRNYRDTVLARIKRDPKFTTALLCEAIASLAEGDQATALSILRDLVHAHITFKTLAKKTGLGEKALHRMLSSHGNPTTENLVHILRVIADSLKLEIAVVAKRTRKHHLAAA
ncbi:MAG TPA: transcriptional regulator [Kiritimatiellia bacterium]